MDTLIGVLRAMALCLEVLPDIIQNLGNVWSNLDYQPQT